MYLDAILLFVVTCDFLVPPTIHRSKKRIDVEEGDDVKLPCKATGDPKPLIEWKKDGVLLQRSNQTTELLIGKIELKDDGTFVCMAVNRVGSVSSSVRVRVLRCK